MIKYRKNICSIVLVLSFMSVMLVGCEFTEGNTQEIELSDQLRIISLSPSQTENLFKLGLEDTIIGVSDYCDYPEAALQIEKMGSSWTVNLERIVEMMPDMVFVYGESHQEALEQMRALSIQVINIEPESLEDVFQSILLTGELTGTSQEAKALVEELDAEKQQIVDKVKGKTPVPVFYQVWDEPLQTAGPDSFIHELITLAGGENIAKNAEGAYPMYSVEALVENNPEIYFMPPHVSDYGDMTKEMKESFRDEIRQRPGYDQIKAIQNDRIELLEPNIASRPGYRIIQGLRAFAEAIHPEVF